MPEPLWKKVQREHHKRMGGQGRCSYRYEDGPDSVPLPWLVVESKSVQEFPKKYVEALQEIVRQATLKAKDLRHLNENVNLSMTETPEDNSVIYHEKLGIVRYHVSGTRYDDDVNMIRAKDFEEWFL